MEIKKYFYSDIKDNLAFEGRLLFKEKYAEFGWEGTSFEFCGEFEGEISMDVEIENTFYVDVLHRLLFYVVVDGKPSKIGPYTDEVKNIILANVEKGFHTVKVIKNTAPIFNRYKLLALNFNGKLAEKPKPKKYAFEFIGDSISAGSCITSNVDKEHPDLDLDTSADIYLDYTGIVCREFDAEMLNVSIHGFGIVNKEGIFCTNSPDIYGFTEYYHDKETMWDFAKKQPRVIVLALGTNDFGFDSHLDDYYPVAKAYYERIRALNPDAFIYWIFGMMEGIVIGNDVIGPVSTVIEKIVADAHDEKLKYIHVPASTEGGFDHPGVDGHKLFADILINDIKNNPLIKL